MPAAQSGAIAQSCPDPLAALLELDGVAEAADEARHAVDRLLVHRVLRRQLPAVAAESTLRGARAAAALSGVDVSLAELRSAEAGDSVIRGAVRAYAGLGTMVDTWIRAPGQVLARLHALAGADLVPVEALGRPKASPEVSQRLSALTQLVVASTGTPAVVLAGVVHAEISGLAPFGSADRVVALAAARLTLRARGLDSNAVSVPEVGVLELETRKLETPALESPYAVMLAGYLTGEPAGLAAWLRWWSAAVALGATEGLAICEALARNGSAS